MRTCPRHASLLLLAGALVVAPAVSGDEGDERDFSSELPRIAPLEPEQSLRALHVLEGYRVELVAAEPLVADPIAIDFDERGRPYVVCMRGYSEQADEDRGEVRLLEDRDADGTIETSTVFTGGLSWPTGILCSRGGVYVAVAPEIIFLRDTDGDGRADERRVVLSGFGRSNVQGLVNSLRWGLDGRVHGATSSSGGLVSVFGAAGAASASVELRGRDFAFDPASGALEATSGGAQHGMCFDDWGRKFVCSNSRHLEMVLFEERDVARNPAVRAPGARRLIAVDGGQAEVFRRSPVEPWRIVRTRLRVAGEVPGPVEGGGRAAGYFTGSTGVTIYRGDALPALRGQAFIGDVGSNIVHRKRLEPDGVAFRGVRIDEGREFVASTEIWFRPVQFANAPDGTLWILDMYREVIEHPASLPPMIKRHLDLTSGRDRGRLWRVVPADADGLRRLAPDLGRASAAELAALLGHENAWHRETAQRLLLERGGTDAVVPLRAVLRDGPPLGRLHALATLARLSRLREADVAGALRDPHPRVREHGVRLWERFATSAALRPLLAARARDDDARVRYETAFAAGALDNGPARRDLLLEIARRDADDELFRVAIQSSLVEGADDFLAALLEDDALRRADGGRRLCAALARQLGAANRQSELAAALRAIEALPAGDRTLTESLIAELAQGLASVGASDAALRKGAAGAALEAMLDGARATALDASVAAEARADATHTLGIGRWEKEREPLERLLAAGQPPAVRAAALEAMSRFDSPDVAKRALEAWPGLGPGARNRAVETLFARRERIVALLDAIEADAFEPTELPRVRIELLRRHDDEVIRTRAAALFADFDEASRDDVVAAYGESLRLAGEPARGREAFRKTCTPCHRAEGQGNEIGPNLAAMKNRGAEAILVNLLDPNREANPEFVSWLVVTRDGRALTGIIAQETASGVTVVRADGESETVLRQEIVSLKSTGLSLMPEGLEADLDRQAVADLIAYVLSLD